jgi:hypothetical protein
MDKIKNDYPFLTAWRKGDLVRMPDGEEFRLTSEGYYCETKQKVVCDTDSGKSISYLKLTKKAYLVETGGGRKNEPCK